MKGNRIYVVYAVVALVLIGAAYLGYTQYKKSQNSPEAQAKAQAVEKDEVLKKLSKLMLLPPDAPVLVKLDNVDQLKSQQAFFQGAINGDIVLIFPQSAKAVIYSPSRNIIVNSGPVQAQPQTNQQQQQEVPATTKVDTTKTPTKTTTTTTKK